MNRRCLSAPTAQVLGLSADPDELGFGQMAARAALMYIFL